MCVGPFSYRYEDVFYVTEDDRQIRYNTLRVLISAQRVLSSSFPPTTVFLEGSELEILRNLMNYAANRETFVETYAENYYNWVEMDDWVEIGGIVASLEGKLMGTNNVAWGYNDIYKEDLSGVAMGIPGSHLGWGSVVPEDEVWIIDLISVTSLDNIPTSTEIWINDGTTTWLIVRLTGQAVAQPMNYEGRLTLCEGMKVGIYVNGVTAGDDISAIALGYKMKV